MENKNKHKYSVYEELNLGYKCQFNLFFNTSTGYACMVLILKSTDCSFISNIFYKKMLLENNKMNEIRYKIQ